MTDPLSISAGVVALGTFAFQSGVTLYAAIRSLQEQNNNTRALKGELNDLNGVLETLLDTVASHPEIKFDGLESPLLRCGKACEDYAKIIAKCTQHSAEGSRPSLRDWFRQQYLQGDINDFRNMLGLYKSTINIALANANLRIASVTPRVIEDYKDMIKDTTAGLQDHLQSLNEKVDALVSKPAESLPQGIEWEALLEEKKSARQGLQICAQLSSQIEQWEAASKEHPNFSQRPSTRKHIKSSLPTTISSIQTLTTRLQSHLEDVDQQLDALRSTAPLSVPQSTQLAQLEETKDSLSQCLNVVSQARENLNTTERNLLEDVSLSDNSYKISVSTVGALFTMRRVTLTGHSRDITAQINDESYQTTIKALTQLDMNNFGPNPQRSRDLSPPKPTSESTTKGDARNDFISRYGGGVSLSQSRTSTAPPDAPR